MQQLYVYANQYEKISEEYTLSENWDSLKNECDGCRRCRLCETRHNVVFGAGNERVEVMLIGEGPGENEDLRGEPFVGRGGILLDKMLEVVDLSRKSNIYIAVSIYILAAQQSLPHMHPPCRAMAAPVTAQKAPIRR